VQVIAAALLSLAGALVAPVASSADATTGRRVVR
jgi:hypothetical protein